MVPVPQAIMRVLTETAAMIIKRGTQTETIFISHQHHHHEQGSNPEQEQQSLLGRISAVNIRASELGYPPYNASIMDGYAIDTDDKMAHISDDHYDDCQLFHVKDRVYAGAATQSQETYVDIDMVEYTNLLPKSIYVTTGAVIPTPYNAVIPMEEVDETDVKEHRIISISHQTLASLKRNAWIRPIGCDIKPDSIILKKGERIEPVHIGLLAQCGIDKVEVTSLPSVGILSTGNELYSQVANRDEKDSAGGDGNVDVALGTIPDANGPVLCSLLSSYGSCQPKFLGIARDDDEDALTTILRDSILEHDVIITTGGISMGEMDIIEEVLVNNLGCKIHFGRLVSSS
jgi:molybdopterin biosynthesis enzyme